MPDAPRPPLWRTLLWGGLVALALAAALTIIASGECETEDLMPQWVLARLAVLGHGPATYDFYAQAALVNAIGLPPHRADILDSPNIAGIGICPYPPTMPVLFAPYGLVDFFSAGVAANLVSIVLALVSAAAVGRAGGGRVSGLACAAALLYYPGFWYNLQLGQNALVTLALWALGWLALVRGRDLVAGLVWGLLAYKVHWLFAVGWLPLVLGRPRVWVGMAASAGVMAAAATAWLGPEAWARWAEQVVAIDRVYAFDADFRDYLLGMSCDLRGVLYRLWPWGPARWVGWAAIGAVMVVTALWYRRRGGGPAGASAPGLLFAVGLTAPHLYYYDQTVFLLPLLALWAQRRLLAWWQIAALAVLTAGFYGAVPAMMPSWPDPWGGPPWATLAVVGLWGLSLTVRVAKPQAA